MHDLVGQKTFDRARCESKRVRECALALVFGRGWRGRAKHATMTKVKERICGVIINMRSESMYGGGHILSQSQQKRQIGPTRWSICLEIEPDDYPSFFLLCWFDALGSSTIWIEEVAHSMWLYCIALSLSIRLPNKGLNSLDTSVWIKKWSAEPVLRNHQGAVKSFSSSACFAPRPSGHSTRWQTWGHG
jgi:hypothetical protein